MALANHTHLRDCGVVHFVCAILSAASTDETRSAERARVRSETAALRSSFLASGQ